ncbi:hypothetical protein D3C86_1342240 [compost metagenome]
MVFQAFFKLTFLNILRTQVEAAGTQGKTALHQIHQRIDLADRSIRPEVFRSVFGKPAGQEYTRKRFILDRNVGICLIIFKTDIVRWLEMLDQRVLQQESIMLIIRYRPFYMHNLVDQRMGLYIIDLFDKIRTDPFLQVLGLTHIQQLLPGIVITIHTGSMRQHGRDFSLELFFIHRDA